MRAPSDSVGEAGRFFEHAVLRSAVRARRFT